jgi:dephospho-CoA kinase
MSPPGRPKGEYRSAQHEGAPMSPLRIGLTGGIGSGKSTVSGMLAARGATIVDTDAIAHALTQPGGAAMPALRAAFGDAVVDARGGLDRAAMRARVFGDGAVQQQARLALEAILHPLIGREAARQGAQAGEGGVVVYDVPLLVESGRWRDRVDRVLVVDCSEATQVARVVSRSGWTEDGVRAVIARQATRERRRAAADAVIVNDGITLQQLEGEVQAVCDRWWPRR